MHFTFIALKFEKKLVLSASQGVIIENCNTKWSRQAQKLAEISRKLKFFSIQKGVAYKAVIISGDKSTNNRIKECQNRKMKLNDAVSVNTNQLQN